MQRHLSQEARGCSHLVLWLDCDREGENICFEGNDFVCALTLLDNLLSKLQLNLLFFFFTVMECTGFNGNRDKGRVYRARFSSVSEKDIVKAMENLVAPNRNEALAVDARQEIDLKVGVAFTRFQTNYFQGKYGNLDARVISLVS